MKVSMGDLPWFVITLHPYIKAFLQLFHVEIYLFYKSDIVGFLDKALAQLPQRNLVIYLFLANFDMGSSSIP
jgi:hypothetical protein